MELLQNYPLSTDLATQIELNALSSSLNNYALSSDLYNLSVEVIDGLSNVVNPKLSVIADLVAAETEKVDTLSGEVEQLAGIDFSSLSTFATKNEISDFAYLSSLDNYATNSYLSGNYPSNEYLSSNYSTIDYLSNNYALDNTLSNYTLLSVYNPLESRVLSVENMIGDILSILQEINDTEEE